MPLLVSSVVQEDDLEPYFSDVEALIRQYEKQVGFIVLDPEMTQEPSTVVDMTSGEVTVIRQSKHQVVL